MANYINLMYLLVSYSTELLSLFIRTLLIFVHKLLYMKLKLLKAATLKLADWSLLNCRQRQMLDGHITSIDG